MARYGAAAAAHSTVAPESHQGLREKWNRTAERRRWEKQKIIRTISLKNILSKETLESFLLTLRRVFNLIQCDFSTDSIGS